ncbi:uncharacterized protein LOC111594656 isoform X1 [Drosophila hydei]|uniref:Uncharacterized protein LOC111594656 isoform X1 n=1 Tax=Drosophila hydei TaxID=7224 RepID=A0A6J1LCL0_DROHY|nr:uncharacterized protein LOC111594656 isoform X1 [Drosophila hydei]
MKVGLATVKLQVSLRTKAIQLMEEKLEMTAEAVKIGLLYLADLNCIVTSWTTYPSTIGSLTRAQSNNANQLTIAIPSGKFSQLNVPKLQSNVQICPEVYPVADSKVPIVVPTSAPLIAIVGKPRLSPDQLHNRGQIMKN